MLFTLFARAAHVDPEQVDAVLALTGDTGAGETVYEDECLDCHEEDGQGMGGASLPEEVPELTDQELVETILSGPWIMPNFVNLLSEQDVADVHAWLRQRWPE
jgi:cytochrome c551